jgi:hypothetical protein
MADGKEFRLLDEILELVISHALGDEIHVIMTRASTAAMDFITLANRNEFSSNASRVELAKVGKYPNDPSDYRPVLDLAHTCRQFRSEVERQLGILCPRTFSFKGNVFLGKKEKKIIIDSESLPHPLLQRLSTLSGISEACIVVGTLGCMKTLSNVNKALPLLWRGEPAVRTPLGMVYIGFANHQAVFSQHLKSMRFTLPTLSDDPGYDWGLSYVENIRIPQWEQDFLYRGIDNLCFSNFEAQLRE